VATRTTCHGHGVAKCGRAFQWCNLPPSARAPANWIPDPCVACHGVRDQNQQNAAEVSIPVALMTVQYLRSTGNGTSLAPTVGHRATLH
jgi:molecular chaperone DnaJ